jgi:hypothetical protein
LHEIALSLDDGASLVGFHASLSPWPSWAESVDIVGDACAEGSGLDAVGETWSVTCASDPVVLTGPTRLATLRYRAPGPVTPDSLHVVAEGVDASLAEAPIVLLLALQ